MRTYRSQRGFTLVEILIVVIILGILAAVVIPQFTSASQDARKNSLASQLQTLRSQIELYKLQHRDLPPPGLMGTSNDPEVIWREMINKTNDAHQVNNDSPDHRFGPYLQSIPRNPLNGFSGVTRVDADPQPGDSEGGAGIGFVFNTINHKLWGTSKSGNLVYNETNPNDENNDL